MTNQQNQAALGKFYFFKKSHIQIFYLEFKKGTGLYLQFKTDIKIKSLIKIGQFYSSPVHEKKIRNYECEELGK